MAQLLLTALIALTGLAAMGVLADSGLRWWSAFGRLRRDRGAAGARALTVHRVPMSYSRFDRAPSRRGAAPSLSQIAA